MCTMPLRATIGTQINLQCKETEYIMFLRQISKPNVLPIDICGTWKWTKNNAKKLTEFEMLFRLQTLRQLPLYLEC